MAQTTLNVRIDEDLKKQFDSLCSDIGMNMSTAISIFAKKAVRERRIPFELTAENDVFYGIENIERLARSAAQRDTHAYKRIGAGVGILPPLPENFDEAFKEMDKEIEESFEDNGEVA